MHLEQIESSDPKVHTANIRETMKELIKHLRRDIDVVDDTRAQVLFETSAEVLEGLVTAFNDYDAGKEVAFRS